MNSARSVSVLIASLLLVTMVGGGIAEAGTTYRFEIEKRQKRIDEIMRTLEKLDGDLKVRQAMFADFVRVHCALEGHVAKLELRGPRFDFAYHPDRKVHSATVSKFLEGPSPEPSFVTEQLMKGYSIDPISVVGGQHVIRTGGELIRTYRLLKKSIPGAVQDEHNIFLQYESLQTELDQLVSEQNRLMEARDQKIAHAAQEAFEGKWILTTANNNTIIYVYFSDADQCMAAVIDTNNLPYFQTLDQLFTVCEVPDAPGYFMGSEYGYNSNGERADQQAGDPRRWRYHDLCHRIRNAELGSLPRSTFTAGRGII